MDGKEIALIAAGAASDKKAEELVVLDLQKLSPITDYFVICSGRSTTQVKAIADSVEEKLNEAGCHRVRREGTDEAGWILIDYIDAVIHIFDGQEREFYNLENLWKDAPRLTV